MKRPEPLHRCMRKAGIGLSVLVVFAGVAVWRQSRADSLFSRIQHGMIVCSRGGSLAENVSAGLTPSMVKLDLAQQPDGKIVVLPAGTALTDALNASHHLRQLVMLAMNDVSPWRVVRDIRNADMRSSVIMAAPDAIHARVEMLADSRIMVAIPVVSAQDEQLARRLARHHPFAAYIPADSDPSLFAMAHRDASAVITETSDMGNIGPVARSLMEQPVDIIVTDQPRVLAGIEAGN